MTRKLLQITILLSFLLPGFTLASEPVVYPAKGQTNEQMEKDKYECYSWAKGQSGFDPMAPPTTSTPPPAKEAQKGGVGRGALRGGLGGLAVGAIAGDAKKGALIGGAGGALIGGMRRSDQKSQEKQKQQQWEQQQVQQYSQKRNDYNRAQAACLEGRGYSVK